MLTAAVTDEFHYADRVRGRHVSSQSRIEFLRVGDAGALALVDGSLGARYRIAFGFSEISVGELGVFCDCQRFAGGFPCKHLWAALTKFDQHFDKQISIPSDLSLFEIDAEEVLVGQPLRGAAAGAGSSAKERSDRDQTVAKRISKTPVWMTQLSRITETVQLPESSPSSIGIPADLLPPAAVRAQHWFVLSVSEPQNQNEMHVAAMLSTPKANGQWSRPVATELNDAGIKAIVDPKERQALSLLKPYEEGTGYGYFPYQRRDNRIFSVDQSLLVETLVALHQTERLAWKLGDSKQHFEDARPIDEITVDQVASVRLSLGPSAGKKSELVLTPEIILPVDSASAPRVYSIDQLIWVSQIGCGIVLELVPTASQPDDEDSHRLIVPNVEDLEPGSRVQTRLITLPPHACALLQSWQSTKALHLPRRSLRKLLRELSNVYGTIDLVIDESLEQAQVSDEPIGSCLLEQSEPRSRDFFVTWTACYPNRELAFDSPVQWWYDNENQILCRRHWQSETQLLSSVDVSEFDISITHQHSEITLPPDRFLKVVESLREEGWEVIANGAPVRIASDFDIQVTSGVDWFDLEAEVSFDQFSADLPMLLHAIRNGQQTVTLDDGTVGMLPEEWLSKFVPLRESGQAVDDALRFHRSQGLLLDLMLQEVDDVARDREFSTFLRQLKRFDGIKPVDASKTFCGSLRDYQRHGLGWMRFLQKFRFGGCLADDMGLGKTIQVLAMLDYRRSRRTPKGEKRLPSIVVVPKSLIFNWVDEATKFTPKLRVLNHTGTQRRENWDQLNENPESVDVLLTTYGTMRIDAPLLAQMKFDYAILDEAQAIKNPKSLVARAARLLPAEHRLAMTGTPIENHLGDLWSLFDFLNPGMLGGAKSQTGLLPDLDDEAQQKHVKRLSKSLQPFIVRRTKAEVLTELPEKVEQTLVCTMGAKQRKLYDQLKEHYRIHLCGKVKELGLKKAKIHVLEALLRLRQAACDPRLVHQRCDVRGAKMDDLLDRLDELYRDGHKVLVFSQFTSLLSLLKNDLNERGWEYEYLDGKTRKRAEKVQRFQNDPECQLFLISMKAGGNGLNLTAADYVFILDPWWNPAVEAQAIDRAHRMGQTNRVNAYRMICEQTVEEKIVQLQKSKQNLADAIVGENQSLISRLTAEDLQELLA